MKALFCCIAIVVLPVSGTPAQTAPLTPSSIPVQDLTISSHVYDLFTTLAAKYRVVIGVYGVSTVAESGRVDLRLSRKVRQPVKTLLTV